MAKKKSTRWRSTAELREMKGRLTLMPNGLMEVAPPSMTEVRQFIASVNPTPGFLPISHKLVERGLCSEQYYQVALACGMTHFNTKTGNFALVQEAAKPTLQED